MNNTAHSPVENTGGKITEVIINGVRYVPVVDASPDMKAITRGILESFWGTLGKDEDLEEKMDGITFRVYDDGQGEPIENVLEAIARELAKHNTTITG